MPKLPLVNKRYKLQKYPGKGGWIYVLIKEIPKDEWQSGRGIRVKGSVDGFPVKQYTLMPLKDKGLFFPINGTIRKSIGKGEGDYVTIILYRDDSELVIPAEFQLCLMDDPIAMQNFEKFSRSEKKAYLDWIFQAKGQETRAKRIAITLDKLNKNLGWYEKEN